MAGDTEESVESGANAAPEPDARLSRRLDTPAFREASHVLVLGPMRRSLDSRACAACLESHRAGRRNVVFVTLTRAATDRVDLLREHLEVLPDRVGVVSGADDVSSTTRIDSVSGRIEVTVEAVSDPSDLPSLGMTISRTVADLTGEEPPVVCLHSITALLQYVDLQRAFRFLNLLQNRLDASIHYHMDPAAHDPRDVATLRSLFDAVVEYDETGTLEVTT